MFHVEQSAANRGPRPVTRNCSQKCSTWNILRSVSRSDGPEEVAGAASRKRDRRLERESVRELRWSSGQQQNLAGCPRPSRRQCCCHIVHGTQGYRVELPLRRQRLSPAGPDLNVLQVKRPDGLAEKRSLLVLRLGERNGNVGAQQSNRKSGKSCS